MKQFGGIALTGGLSAAFALLVGATLEAECSHPNYSFHIVSLSPLVIYIPDFVTPGERAHLLKTSANEFSKSRIADKNGTETLAKTRTSSSAIAPRDAVTRCIEERALLFQGFDTLATHLEPLQLVKYTQSETYNLHTDWFTSAAMATPEYGGNRLSSFFVYVEASDDITGGGTSFPMLDVPKDERWCKYIDCDVSLDDGVSFRPIPGNAVFWVNMIGGNGDQRVIHRGDVVSSGSKVGMNIWTRQFPMNRKYNQAFSNADEEDDADGAEVVKARAGDL